MAAIVHMDNYLFFWGHTFRSGDKKIFSNWFPSPFVDENQVVYATNEHYMMAEKARLFGDHQILDKILKSNDPKEAKALGRRIKGFNESVWAENCKNIVIGGLLLKFSQHPELRDFLRSTGDKTLVEASPYDRIWGIGLNEKDAKRIPPHQWPGKNLLGECLMEVRERLQ